LIWINPASRRHFEILRRILPRSTSNCHLDFKETPDAATGIMEKDTLWKDGEATVAQSAVVVAAVL
jgi:hypothetical protein